MNNKELPRGRQTLGMARTERMGGRSIRTAPEVPVRTKDDPTKQEAADANAGKSLNKTENAILSFAKRHPVATAGSAVAAVVGGFAAVEAYQGNIPGIHRSVEDPIPTHFDSNAEVQAAKAGVNAKPIPQDVALALAKENPPQLHEGDFPTLPLIFIGKLTNGGEAIIKTSYVNQAYNPIAQKPDRLNTGKEIIFTKAGTELAITLEEFEVFQIDPLVVKDIPYFAGVVLRFNGPDGVRYKMSIDAEEDIRHLEPTEIIKNAPTVGENGIYLGTKDYEKIKNQKGLTVQGPISILRTTENNTRVRIGAGPILDKYPKGLPAKILFITQDNQLVFPQLSP